MSINLDDFKALNTALLSSNKRLVVAYSGGLDSTVLLHLLNRITPANRLIAWHMNHQLQQASDEMQAFCEHYAQSQTITINVSRLGLGHLKSNIESQAREARYRRFSDELSDNDILLTAHHADDQVESILLNLLRGSGVAGLRGVAKQSNVFGVPCYRPLLAFSRDDIAHYADQHQLTWFEDPSNSNQDFDRNLIRHRVTPVLKQRWPAVGRSFQAVSLHQQEAYECLADLFTLDLAQCEQIKEQGASLLVDKVRALSFARQKNLFRFWLKQFEVDCTHQQLNELVKVLCSYQTEVKKVLLRSGFVGFFNGQIFCVKNEQICNESDVQNELKNRKGCFVSRYSDAQSISRHFLKRQFQTHKIPPWFRDQTIFQLDDMASKRVIKVITL